MDNERVGVSLTKIIDNGNKLLANMDRGVKVVQEKGTSSALNRVCSKIEEFYDSLSGVQLSGDNRSKVINILKGLRQYKDTLINLQTEINNKEMSNTQMSPSM